MRGRRVLVTGGAGFIGSHLVDALLAAGASVRILDDLDPGTSTHVPAQAEFLCGDVADESTLTGALDGIDLVYHLAAIASVPRCEAEPVRSEAVNLAAVRTLVERADVPVVFASSAAIYGVPRTESVAEDHPIAPLGRYGEQKAAADALICEAGHVAMRFFNVYGARQNPSSPYAGVLSIFCERAREEGGLVLFGDGEQTRDFIHVSDVVAALLATGANFDSMGGCAYNVCTGSAHSLLEVVEMLRGLTGAALPIDFQPARSGDIRHSLGDPSALGEALGWSAEVALEDGLADLL